MTTNSMNTFYTTWYNNDKIFYMHFVLSYILEEDTDQILITYWLHQTYFNCSTANNVGNPLISDLFIVNTSKW